jgi:hypothetical protein
MDNKIIDEMKKEGKSFLRLAIFATILFALTYIYIYVNEKNFQDKVVLSMLMVYSMFSLYGLYGWLYSIKYRVEFDNERVYLKTLFRKIELNICDVKKYTCNRYRKSVFYQFNLFINDKKILINTRYKDEFEKVLNDYKIEQIIK